MLIIVKWMIRQDLPEVLEIERQTFGSWSEQDFLMALRDKPVIGMTAVDENGVVLGYVVYERDDQCYVVLNLAATCPEARRALIYKVRDKAYNHHRHLMWDTP